MWASGRSDGGKWEERCGRAKTPPGHKEEQCGRIYYQREFRGDEVVKCSVLRKLELTAKEMLKREAMSRKVKSFEEAQRERIAEFERMVDNSEGHAEDPKLHQGKIKVGRGRNVRAAVREREDQATRK